MSTPKEQFDLMLDELPADEQMRMINHVPFARILEDIDPIAYRCGMADFEATCDECGEAFWPDDAEAEAICEACAAKEEEEV